MFTGIYGTAWVADSIVIRILVSVSASGLVAFCMACEPGRDRGGEDPAAQPEGERLRGTLGADPTDRLLITGPQHLRAILDEYVAL